MSDDEILALWAKLEIDLSSPGGFTDTTIAFARAVERAALERAEEICSDRGVFKCADSIRALIKPEG